MPEREFKKLKQEKWAKGNLKREKQPKGNLKAKREKVVKGNLNPYKYKERIMK